MHKDFYNWQLFIDDVECNIMPIYLENERKFDFAGIHGRIHIARAIVFAEYMIRYYSMNNHTKWSEEKINSIRYATALHDSARKRNGPDFWENESAQICYNYLQNKGFSKLMSKSASEAITQKGIEQEKFIVKDADVLEIMRPLCGHGGIYGFKTKKLVFLSENDLLVKNKDVTDSFKRIRFIEEAWALIQISDKLNEEKQPNLYLPFILEIIKNNKDFTLLKTVL